MKIYYPSINHMKNRNNLSYRCLHRRRKRTRRRKKIHKNKKISFWNL